MYESKVEQAKVKFVNATKAPARGKYCNLKEVTKPGTNTSKHSAGKSFESHLFRVWKIRFKSALRSTFLDF